MEEWKDIPGYEGIYQASNFGRIRSSPGKVTSSRRYSHRVWKTRVLKPKCGGGRHDLRVSLWKNGKEKYWLVSRLVALTWCEGYKDGLTVNHIDGDFQNNRPENLEWVSLSENIKLGFETGLYDKLKIKVILKNGEWSRAFNSKSDASKFLGRNSGYVGMAMRRGNRITDIAGNLYIAEEIKSKNA